MVGFWTSRAHHTHVRCTNGMTGVGCSHEALQLLLRVHSADVTPQAAVQHLADGPHDGAQQQPAAQLLVKQAPC